MAALDFSEVMETFATPLFIVQASGVDGGHYEHGEFVTGHAGGIPIDDAKTTVTATHDGAVISVRPKGQFVNEPLMPPSGSGKADDQIIFESGGAIHMDDLLWYSYQANVPVDTLLIDLRSGLTYQVKDSASYANLTDPAIYLYLMKAVRN